MSGVRLLGYQPYGSQSGVLLRQLASMAGVGIGKLLQRTYLLSDVTDLRRKLSAAPSQPIELAAVLDRSSSGGWLAENACQEIAGLGEIGELRRLGEQSDIDGLGNEGAGAIQPCGSFALSGPEPLAESSQLPAPLCEFLAPS